MSTASRKCIKEGPLTPSSNPQHLQTPNPTPSSSISETFGTSLDLLSSTFTMPIDEMIDDAIACPFCGEGAYSQSNPNALFAHLQSHS
ncbi:hypothetical protein FS837_000041 [Tulasnella sp. UAMH 9824]|nr:hypothetical protein FS837_000041 [Tulasnella sp. UAMH 9824]